MPSYLIISINHPSIEMTSKALDYALPSSRGAAESKRLAIQHELSLLDLNGGLVLNPLFTHSLSDTAGDPLINSESSFRVADLGTGTGSWAIELAKRYPSVCVVGMDLDMPILPHDAPENVCFAIQDVQAPWASHGATEGLFDFIHGRQILLNLPHPELAVANAWDHLRPGGYIEFREYWHPMVSERCEIEAGESDDRTVPLLVEWHNGTGVAEMALSGADHGFAAQLPAMLERQGFVDVNVVDHNVPLGEWTFEGSEQDERTRRMDTLLRDMWRMAIPQWTPHLYCKGLGWSQEEAVEYGKRVVRELDRDDLADDRIYARFRMVWARKPPF